MQRRPATERDRDADPVMESPSDVRNQLRQVGHHVEKQKRLGDVPGRVPQRHAVNRLDPREPQAPVHSGCRREAHLQRDGATHVERLETLEIRHGLPGRGLDQLSSFLRVQAGRAVGPDASFHRRRDDHGHELPRLGAGGLVPADHGHRHAEMPGQRGVEADLADLQAVQADFGDAAAVAWAMTPPAVPAEA